MNPESLKHIPKEFISDPAVLGRVCWNFADNLSAHKWALDEVRTASLTRSMTDQDGMMTVMGEKVLKPISNGIQVSLFAGKQIREGYRGNLFDLDTYRLIMSVSQSIGEPEVPPYVLDNFFDVKSDTSDSDDDDEGLYDTVLDEVERDNLEDFEIVRDQTITYELTGSGDIDAYDLTHTYLIDGEPIHEVNYSSDEGVHISVPITDGENGEELDRKPAVLLALSATQLQTEIEDLDASWLQFVNQRTVSEIASFGAQDQEQHRRQALAMISMLSSGIFSLDDLAQYR